MQLVGIVFTETPDSLIKTAFDTNNFLSNE